MAIITNRIIYARIYALSMEERVLDVIEGRITSGSVNIDGASAVRRTCSLSMVSDQLSIADYLWSLNTKFKLEIGLQDSATDEIKWYKQGIYIITSFSSALSVNSFTINISGKDKMCKLNGENGGAMTSQVDFGQIEEIDKNGNRVLRKRPLYEIIRDSVHFYGNEPLHNIIIEDLDEGGLQIETYRHNIPLYLLRIAGSDTYYQVCFDKTVYIDQTPKSIAKLDAYDMDTILDTPRSGQKFTLAANSNTMHQAKKIQYGESPGYTATELVYSGDLIANVGEALTSILDKIKNMLGNFEYFYDLDGRFIFRRQQSYIDVPFTPVITSNNSSEKKVEYVDPYAKEYQFEFLNNDLITSINRNPQLSNVKNDFSIWGSYKNAAGNDLAIHLRYAIDVKPQKYTTIAVSDNELINYNTKYNFNITGQQSATYTSQDYDWREIIYRMALDYFKYNHLDDFTLKVAEANPELYASGITGYEQYYSDMQAFWRELYSPEPVYKRVYQTDITKLNSYFILTGNGTYTEADSYSENGIYYIQSEEYYDQNHKYKYWNKKVIENPETLHFWIDFLDTDGELSAYSVKSIGIRPKVVNDKDVKAIYYRGIPSVTWGVELNPGATASVLQLPEEYKGMFSPSAQGKSTLEALSTLLYNHVCNAESVSITCVPIYDLEPNKKIYIEDSESQIIGDYLVGKITIPLTYNGTMSITASKVVERI